MSHFFRLRREIYQTKIKFRAKKNKTVAAIKATQHIISPATKPCYACNCVLRKAIKQYTFRAFFATNIALEHKLITYISARVCETILSVAPPTNVLQLFLDFCVRTQGTHLLMRHQRRLFSLLNPCVPGISLDSRGASLSSARMVDWL